MVKVLLLLFLFSFNAHGVLKVNYAFKAFFWTMDSAKSANKNGCYGYSQVDSVQSSDTEHNHYSSLWLTYSWWHIRFKMSYMPIDLIYSKTKPQKITRCPNHFLNVEWISGINSTAYKDSIRFYFPILPMNQLYGRYDYFTVDVDDSLDIEFYGAGDSIMVGTFVHKKPDARGAVNILGRNAIIIELSKSNPLRVKSIRCDGKQDSLLNIFLRFPLDSLKKDMGWYGLDILDTMSSTPRIKVFDINLSGTQPYTIGTKRDITWKLEGKSEIDSCIITYAPDKINWNPIGRTDLDTIFYNWMIPNLVTDTTILKVTACGKHSEKISATQGGFIFSKPPQATKIRSLQLK